MISNNNIKNIMTSLFTKSKTEHDKDINDLNTNMNKGWISSGTIEDIQGSKTVEAAPVGTIISLMGNSAPSNYLICDGTEYNIEDYTELSNYFLEQFGSINYFGGDGTTTFAVPDLTDGRFLKGSTTAGTMQSAGLPNITASAYFDYGTRSCGPHSASGAFYSSASKTGRPNSYDSNNGAVGTLSFSASRSSSIYGNSTTVTPSNISVLYCIKYRTTYNLGINLYDSTHYSEDEEVIGQWIDGKPLYRKTFTNLSMPQVVTNGTAVTINIDHNISNAEIIRYESFISNGVSVWNGTIYMNTVPNFAAIWVSSSAISLRSSLKDWNDFTVKVIVEYTKSTDTAFNTDEDIAWTALDSEVEEVINNISEE